MNRRLQDFQEKLGPFYLPLVGLLVTLIIGLLGYSHVKPKTYHFELNQVADQTILAPATIEDQEQTAINKQRARDSVKDIYLFQEDVRDRALETVGQFFARMKLLRNNRYTLKRVKEMAALPDIDWPEEVALLDEVDRRTDQAEDFMNLTFVEQLVIFKADMAQQPTGIKDLAQALSQSSVEQLVSMNNKELARVQDQLEEDLASSLEKELSSAEVEEETNKWRSRLTSSDLSYANQQLFLNFFDHLIQPTLIYSETETNRLKDEAEAQVQPSYILQGQVIIQKGHIISQNNLRQLNLYGYLDSTTRQNLMLVFMGLIVIHGFLMVAIFSDGFKWRDIKTANREITAYGLMLVGSLLLVKVGQMMKGSQMTYATLMVPVMILPILLKPKIKMSATLMALIALNLFSLFFISDNDNQTMVTFVSLFYWFVQGISLIMVLSSKFHQITYPRLLGVQLVIQYAVALALMVALNITVFSSQGLTILVLVLIANLLGILLLATLTPYWEQLLSDKAPMTLNQLANLNHPLLKLLIEKAPGTYHHSMMVANLAANAVEVIGGDSLMTRVAAYYHDIGKTVHPLFFVENLSGGVESPHRMVEAEESAAIIIDHVNQGVRILNDYHMPQSIIDVCQQHHGTTPVAYFYHQAKSQKANVQEGPFRYPGPIPQSKEIAVMMIADSLEAASRTMADYSQEAIESLVDAIIQGKISDGQFAQSGLTVDELYRVRRSLISGIGSMYHTRIDYPK